MSDSEEEPVKKKKKKKKVIRRVIKVKRKKKPEGGEEPTTPGSGKKKKKKIIRRVVRRKKKDPTTPIKKSSELFPDTPVSKSPGKSIFDKKSKQKTKKGKGEEEEESGEDSDSSDEEEVELSEEKKKELADLQKVTDEEVKTRIDGMISVMRLQQKPYMTATLKKMNEHMVKFMKGVIGEVTNEVKDLQIIQKMAELNARERKIEKKELEIKKRLLGIKKTEKRLKKKEEEFGKLKKKKVNVGMGVCAREYMEIDDKFEDVDKGHFSIARDSENINKNRYSNILPYNHTLVKLESKKYINANHIDMYGLRFIGTQWPLDTASMNTEEEFWEMNYDHDVHVVVALQKPVPPKHQYYMPREKGEQKSYGKMVVYHKDKIVHPFFQVISCLVKKGGGKIKDNKEKMKGVKEVKVCLFMTWPDHGIPKKQHPLFAMIKTARLMNIDISRAAHERREFPLVVHCSAGVGRTGVYIVCDVCIQKGFGTEKVKEVLIEMRKQRYGMIQNAKQYKYVYDLVNQYKTED